MEIVAWDLARHFVRSGYATRVITTALLDKQGEFKHEGVSVAPLREAPPRRYSAAWWTASRAYFEQHCMESTQAVLSVSAAAFGVLPIKAELPHVPFVMQAHGTSWGEVISKWRSRRLKSILSSTLNLIWLPKDLLNYQKFDAVVAVGERVRQDLTKPPVSWVLPKNKVHLINNGIDTSIFSPSQENRKSIRTKLGLDEKTPIVMSASRLHAQKGVIHALRAFSLVLKAMPDAIYLIAGDGPERASLASACSELGMSKSVRFLGALRREELAPFLQAADAFIFLTEHIEGLPLNIMEALACGLPCVISDHLSLFESTLLKKVEPRNASAASNEILKIIELYKTPKQVELPEEYFLDCATDSYLSLFRSQKSADTV